MAKELTHIVPPISNGYLTAGKKYPVVTIIRKANAFKSWCVKILDDSGEEITIDTKESAHLNGLSCGKIYS